MNRGFGAKHLLIGLDGMGLDLVRQFGPARMPQLHALMGRGVCSALRSVQPPATLPNWATLLTGDDPGVHGVFDFTTRTGYRVHFTAGSVRATPTIAARLDRLGHSCACLFFPGTFPPEQLQHGVFISGWDAPVAFEADDSFVWPRRLHEQIVARFGPQRFDDVDEFDADAPGWHARLPGALAARIARRSELAAWLLRDRQWDLFAVYFGQSDTAAHHLWSLHDPRSPRRPARLNASESQGLGAVYEALDRAVGELMHAAGGQQVEVTVVSDHGSGGASDKVLYLNRALEEAGLLRFKETRVAPALLSAAKQVALTRLPPKLREQTFRGFGAVLPGWLESRARFSAIDMARTQVFSDELNYFPALHWNLRGREPQGTVAASELAALREQLQHALMQLRDPWSGLPVVRALRSREELWSGPQLARAPDLLLELALDAGYSYNLMPSVDAPPGTGAFRRLAAHEYLGRKGRSLPGSHRPRGLFIAAGPEVAAAGELDAAMADVTATLLARMRLRADTGDATASSGRVLDQALAGSQPGSSLPHAQLPAARRNDGARIEARLRRLGYVE